jgi:hypothetical protein
MKKHISSKHANAWVRLKATNVQVVGEECG